MKEKKYRKQIISLFLIAFTLIATSCAAPNPYEDDERYSIYLKDVEEGYSGSFEEWLVEYLKEYHKVFFDSAGGSFVDEVVVEHDRLLNEPFVYKLGHSLVGWYKDNEEWDFSSNLINESITLVASWKIEEELIKELPIVDIDLKGELLENVNRQDYIDTNISITNSLVGKDLIQEEAEFRGRGHGSWQYDKKGYRIKFNKKQAVFGLAKSKHWVLVAEGHDKSLIRNNLAYTITNEVLDNILYQTAVNEVNLYVNGEYRGVYSLFEQIRVDEDRVNIYSEFGVIDTGYLIEYNYYAPFEGGEEGINYFNVKGMKYPFEIKSPDPDDYLEEGIAKHEYKEQVDFIKDYVQQVVDTLLDGDYETFSLLADVPSFLDAYLIHELFKNTDTGWSSFYLYKEEGGKLFAGPVWDFDYSSGISRGDSSYRGIYVGESVETHSPDTANEIFVALMKQEGFISQFKERINDKSPAIRTSIDNYQTKISGYEASYTQDALKWSEGTKVWQTEQNRVLLWLKNRLVWFKEWANEE